MSACSSAADRYGRRFSVGAIVRLVGPGGYGRPVKVVSIWKQGANGTQIQTDPSPSETYPHHFQARASNVTLDDRPGTIGAQSNPRDEEDG
jgi:hypothetical protein